MRSQREISHLKEKSRRPFLWFSVHIEADLHGRTGGANCLPQKGNMNNRTSVSPLSVQNVMNIVFSFKSTDRI